MSAISREGTAIVKKDMPYSRYNPIATKKIVFAHQLTVSQVGLTVITLDLKNLNTPSSMSANGFVQATQSEINGANLAYAKKNLSLTSNVKGKLLPFIHYIVVDNYTVQLIGDMASAAELNEILVGEIDSQIGDLIPASVSSQLKAFTQPAGQTTVNIGLEFQVGKNSTERVGQIKVFVRGSLLFRNTGNSSSILDGDYYEVDSGNGYGTTIVLNSAPTIALDILVDMGVNTITNNDSLGTLQSLIGSVKKIATDLATVIGGSSTDYLTANPSDIERRTFGDYVLSLLSRVGILENKQRDFYRYNQLSGYGSINTKTPYYLTASKILANGVVSVTNNSSVGVTITAIKRCEVYVNIGVNKGGTHLGAWMLNATLSELQYGPDAAPNKICGLTYGSSVDTSSVLPYSAYVILEVGDVLVPCEYDSNTSGAFYTRSFFTCIAKEI